MHPRVLLAAPLALVTIATAQPQELPFVQRARALAAAHPDVVGLAEIGASRGGRAIVALRLAAPAEGSPKAEDRPATAVVAGIDGRHLIGAAVAVGLAEKLVEEHSPVLEKTTLYVVPCANPDTLIWQLDQGHPATDFGRTISHYDADHDGRVGEDPGEDLDGDGAILTMRVKNPPPGSGLRAEYAIDPENPRLLKKADAAKGERAEYALLVEGRDADGDGKFSEDGVGGSAGGGVDLNLNFPYRWPEFTDGSGRFELSEPESLALVKWMLGTPNLGAVLSFGPGDTLVNVPEAGKFDPSGQVPTGIENADKPCWEEISKLFKEATRQTGAPKTESAGSFQGWAYAVYGTFSFSTPVWVRPDLIKKDEPKKDGETKDGDKKEGEKKQGEEAKGEETKAAEAQPPPPAPSGQPPAGGGRAGGRRGGPPGGPRGPGRDGAAGATAPKPGEPSGDDAKWLKYSDEVAAAGGKAGFVDWHPFKHPQLGDVEIGGFLPGFKLNPPPAELERLVAEQAKFVTDLLAKLPRVTAEDPLVERLGPGLWRITVRLVNDGYLPSMPEIGNKARRGLPTLITMGLPLERVVSGEKHNRAWVIPGSGGRFESQWIVRGDDGEKVEVKIRPSIGPLRKLEVELKEGPR